MSHVGRANERVRGRKREKERDGERNRDNKWLRRVEGERLLVIK
jgi:hypothetical protein